MQASVYISRKYKEEPEILSTLWSRVYQLKKVVLTDVPRIYPKPLLLGFQYKHVSSLVALEGKLNYIFLGCVPVGQPPLVTSE